MKRRFGYFLMTGILCFSLPLAAQSVVVPQGEPREFSSLELQFNNYGPEVYGTAPAPGQDLTSYTGGSVPLPSDSGRQVVEIFGEFTGAQPGGAPASLYLGPTNSPVELFLNGVLLYRWGNGGEPYVSTNYTSAEISLPPQLLKSDGSPDQIALRLYPIFQTSPLPTIKVGTAAEIAKVVFFQNLFRAYLIRAASVLALFLGFYFLMLFLSRGNRQIRYLWFALFSFAFFAAYLEISLSFGATAEILIKRVSKIGFVWSLTFLTFFLIDFAKARRIKRPLQILMTATGGVFTILFTLQGTVAGIEATLGLVILVLFGPALILDAFLVIRSAFRYRNALSRIILVSFLFCLTATFHDMYVITVDVIPYAYLTAYGFLALVIGIFSVLVLEQGRISQENARWAHETEENNQLMRSIFERVTAVSAGLSLDGESLNRTVGETRELVENSARTSSRQGEEIQRSLSSLEERISLSAESMEVSTREIPESLDNLSQFSRSLSGSVDRLAMDLDSLISGASVTAAQAEGFSSLADSGSAILAESSRAVSTISEYSSFVEDVLQTVEGISEQMHLLSINASIEAARAGTAGQGFTVVAHEIRTLSHTARERLSSSFEKIEALKDVVRCSGELGRELDKSLAEIMGGAKSAAADISRMAESLEQERSDVHTLLEKAEAMGRDTSTIGRLVETGKVENARLTEAFGTVKSTIQTIRSMVQRQQEESQNLRVAVESVASVGESSVSNAEILKSIVRENLIVEDPGSLKE